VDEWASWIGWRLAVGWVGGNASWARERDRSYASGTSSVRGELGVLL
jgi:hypothetical protein